MRGAPSKGAAMLSRTSAWILVIFAVWSQAHACAYGQIGYAPTTAVILRCKKVRERKVKYDPGCHLQDHCAFAATLFAYGIRVPTGEQVQELREQLAQAWMHRSRELQMVAETLDMTSEQYVSRLRQRLWGGIPDIALACDLGAQQINLQGPHGEVLWQTQHPNKHTPILKWQDRHYTVIKAGPAATAGRFETLMRRMKRRMRMSALRSQQAAEGWNARAGGRLRLKSRERTPKERREEPRRMAPPEPGQQPADVRQGDLNLQEYIVKYPELVFDYGTEQRCRLCTAPLTQQHVKARRHNRRLAAWIRQDAEAPRFPMSHGSRRQAVKTGENSSSKCDLVCQALARAVRPQPTSSLPHRNSHT